MPHQELGNKQVIDIDPTNCNKGASLLLGKQSYFQVQLHFSTNFPFFHLKGHLENAKKKSIIFPEKLSASFWIVQSTLLAVFPEEQLKELREAEVTVLLGDVGKVEVLSLAQ